MRAKFDRRSVHVIVGLAIVIAAFVVPLTRHLDRRDLYNDEAIYSYAAERMLEIGDWVTPRSSPTDDSFFEKPPLKFWLVAGALKLGMPHTDAGMRSIDIAFAALAFVYIYLLGVRIHGVIAGLTAMLVFFTFPPLLFEHGLRTANMEAAVVLAYCAGLYHFMQWLDARGRSPRHAAAVCAAFFLGLMTKFVVMAFFPAIALVVIAFHPDRRQLLRRWPEWVVPVAVTVLAAAPWFIYQTIQDPKGFWSILMGQHVIERFATGLDPTHRQPWHFYITSVVEGLSRAGCQWVVAAGLLFVAAQSVKRERHAHLLLAWTLIPLVAISFSSSKLIHYIYPFLPPVAVAAGWAVGAGVAWLEARGFWPSPEAIKKTRLPRALQYVLFVAGVAAAGVFAVSVGIGHVHINVGNTRLFSNSSLVRPAILAVALLWLATRQIAIPFVAAAALLGFSLPVRAYSATLAATHVVDRPLGAMADCLRTLQQSGVKIPSETILPSGLPPSHSYFYYLRRFGPYHHRDIPDAAATDAALARGDDAPFAIFSAAGYAEWLERQPEIARSKPAFEGVGSFVVVLPASAQSCATAAITATARR